MMGEGKNPYDLLFVEDEKAIRNNYVEYLKRYFTNVYEAEDGEQAYQVYKEKKPHILIVDIHLPKFNGIELLQRIRKDDHTTKAIMLTAQSDTHYLLAAAELKLTKYLVKPVSRNELKGALDKVIEELSKFGISAKKLLLLKEEYSWDYESKQLSKNEEEVPLTNKEQQIIELFFSYPKKTFTYDEIIYEVWPYAIEDKVDALKTILKNLRKKLPEDSIRNIFGVGYKLIL